MQIESSITPADHEEFLRLLDRFNSTSDFERAYAQKAKARGWLTLSHLPKASGTKVILDVGSMKGLYAPAYVKIWKYNRVYLLGDNLALKDEFVVKVQGEPDLRCPCANCNIEVQPWPFQSSFFDTVIITEVLEHLMFDPVFTMNEICRVLKPGGLCLLTTPNTNSDSCLAYLVNGMQPGFLRYYSTTPLETSRRDLETIALMGHFHEYTRADLECLVRATGFEFLLLKGISASRPLLDSWRFRVLKGAVHLMVPRSRRIREDHLLALIRKKAYVPLDQLSERYPAPLYQTATA
jgi:SAM-dependent methyltransferase